MSRERWSSGWERLAAAERECEQLRALLRQVRRTTGLRDITAHLIDSSGLLDPWDACLAVDPFTGQPDHEHGDACVEKECCE